MKGLRYLFLCFWCCVSTVHADDLAQIYSLAQDNDPTLQAAYADFVANKQALPEAVASMVPHLSATYRTTGYNSNVSLRGFDFNTRSYGFNLNLPLYRAELWAQLEQARHTVKAATANYMNANQSLIFRVAQQYFIILAATDDLNFNKAQRVTFARNYEQNKERQEVGLISITDVEDAKARYDRAVADEIISNNTLQNEYEILREMVGCPIEEVVPLPQTHTLHLIPPTPAAPEEWVCMAQDLSFDIQVAKETAEQYKAAIGTQTAGHLPSVDLLGQIQRQKGIPPFPFSAFTYEKNLTLTINVPIFSGGGVLYKTREAMARYDQAMKKLDIQQRNTNSNVRQAYRSVLAAINSVTALAQVVVSNQGVVDATNASYEIGTRTMVDVLDAETRLLGAKRDHSKARYNYIMEGLRLKQATGILTPDDIIAVNDMLCGRQRLEEAT